MTEPRRPMTAQQEAQARSENNYAVVVSTLKENKGAEARAIRAMLGGDKALFDRFLATTFALLVKHPDVLADASPASIVQSIKDAASLGLEPLTSDGAIIVRKGVAGFQPMWQGHLKRIRNSGKVQDIDTQVVYEADQFEYWTTEKGGAFKHVPAMKDRGGYWGVYAYAVMPSGFVELEVMSEAEVNHVRDHFSEGWKNARDRSNNPWTTSWGEMARKTVLLRLEKRLPSAAVDALLAIEARIQANEREALATQVATKDELSEVRALALQAVGAVQSPAPALEAGTALESAQPEATSGEASGAAPNAHEQEWGPLG